MKKYTKPEMEFKPFGTEDILTTSSSDTENPRELKDIVNGNKGADYGSKSIYNFD